MDITENSIHITHILQHTPDNHVWSNINYKAKTSKHKKNTYYTHQTYQ